MTSTVALVRPAAESVAANRSRLAQTLRTHRRAVARAFMQSVAGWDKYAAEIQSDPDGFLEREIFAFVDYLALYFERDDPTYKNLYIGEKLKQTFRGKSSPQELAERRAAVTESDGRHVQAALADRAAAEDLDLLQREMDDLARVVTSRAKHVCNVLFVGDCLFQDLVSFLAAPCLEDDITIQPTYVTSRNPAETRKEIRELADRKFDLVFYSPFTYDQSPEYNALHKLGKATASAAAVRQVVDGVIADAKATLDLLSHLFECNIFVHNSANIRRHDGTFAERFKNFASRRVRRLARNQVNAWLAEDIAARNKTTFDHHFLVDEAALLQRHGDDALGRKFYSSLLQHPAALGKWLAEQYRDLIAAHTLLLKKKLVVCDLDNTLWEGVIGEGAGVKHYAEKQRILKRLQAKGVVLAINSKNDPKNVRWDGGVLCADDFVCSQINWDNKVLNLKRIGEFLNLKTKDFVFIDDRRDEREMVKMAIPEVLTLDATDDRAWRLLGLWADVLSSQGETDRTQFYKQREQRQGFLDQQAKVDAEDQAKLFAQLGIQVSIRRAATTDLKRVAELINRTNQFNLCGSRTSVREVTAWHESPDWRILVVDAGDKFGSMGTVCIMIVHQLPDRIEIPIFVLSCRVFGYGIEHALVNYVKRMAAKANPAAPLPIVGLYQETPHNEPCRKVYPTNGFEWDGQAWRYAKMNEPTADAAWLTIRCEA